MAMDLSEKHLIVGLTGGIAAYKTCELIRRLRDHGATVTAAMTQAAQAFIGTTTLQALTGRPVLIDMWASDGQAQEHASNAMPHIEVSRRADAIVVAPATAHFMAQVANGLAPDLLTTMVLARRCPLLLAPAMNVEMWHQAATQRNLKTLREDGVEVFGPAQGVQACGESGAGRMLEAHELTENIITYFQPKLLQNKRVLITAGPTFEPIDPVRGITNLSSGKAGFALARAAHEAGAQVTLIAGPVNQSTPHGVRRINVLTAQEMLEEVLAYIDQAHIFISVAAVADWRVAQPSDHKIKKTNVGAQALSALALTPNPDILATVAALPNPPYCVGFAAESQDVVTNAQEKLARKKVHMVVGNLAQDTLGADQSELALVTARGVSHLPRADKLTQARRLIAHIAQSVV